MKKLLMIAVHSVSLLLYFHAGAQLYWRTDGSNFLLTNPVWGTTSSGPFTNAWINNSNIFITGSSGNAITNVSNTPVGNITITGSSATNWGNAGTFSTGGNIRTIDIGSGSVLTWNNQPVSTAVGTGFIKNGAGTWNIGSQPNLFTGGFTLNNGTIVINGDNALGAGIFYLNGGTIQSSATRDMAVSSIILGGDFEHTGSGNQTWSMNMSLGSLTRSILNSTASGSRRYTGVVSGSPGAGMTFNGSGLAQVYFGNPTNSFSGPITINGGEVVFNDEACIGASASITIDGGRLTFAAVDALGNNTYIASGTLGASRTVYVGSLAGTSISVPGTGSILMNAVITDKAFSTGSWAKQGGGRLTIVSTCTYTGNTFINNGTLQLAGSANRLPPGTILYIGQAANANLGNFDLNGYSQQVAGLNSVTGTNTTAIQNTITSATAATLTVSAKGKFGMGTTFNSGIITGMVSLVKSGIDTLELGDANTYTGNTTVSGGVLRLNRAGGTTIPSVSNVTVNGGTLRISSNQTLNNLTVSSGSLLVDAGITLTISGGYSGGGAIANNGTIIINATNNFPGSTSTVIAGFNNLTIGAAVNLDQSLIINGTLTLNATFGLGNYTLTLNGPAIAGVSTNLNTTIASSLVFGGAFTSVFIPTSVTSLANLSVGNSNGVSVNSILSVFNSVTLSSGTLTITAGRKLEFNGASLASTGGYIAGTNTSDLGVIGTTGGIINLPTNNNISLRNITISGNRTLKMNGIHHISLSGALTIAAGSAYDNGGESQLINGTGGSISVTGTFITRDIQGFSASGAAIPGIVPVLNAGCTIEYALTGNQAVQGATVPYKNVRFSGSGIKLLASTTSPNGTVFVTGSAIVNTNGFNLGGVATALTMDGGRLIITTGSTQPSMLGAYNLTGGVVEFKGPAAGTIRTNTYQNIEVSGPAVSNSTGNITLRNSGSFTVTSTGVFTINDNCITGILPTTNTQTVTVQGGGLFRCGNNQGFNGFTSTLTDNSSVHANITNIILSAGSTVEYSRNNDQPVTNANGLAYQNLLLSGSAGIKTAPPGNLVVNGNLTKSGAAIFAHNNGTVSIDGTTAQSYTSSAPVMEFYDLGLNNPAGFATLSDMTIINQLSFGAGAKLNLQAGYITLRSDASNTASVGVIPASASISYLSNTGFITERYIASGTLPGQHTKSWQFIAVPVNGEQTVNQGWQENATYINENTKPGYGTQITSNVPGALGLGFDVYTPSGGPSMKFFNASTVSWEGIPSTATYQYNPKGYLLFVRGDRSVTNFSGPNSAPLPTVLRSTGQLFTPASNPPSPMTVITGKLESVGNPYASAIDFLSLAATSSGIDSKYYVWDPLLPGTYGLGAYQTISSSNGYMPMPGGTINYPTGIPYTKIQSGQAFFVYSTPGGTVSFTENNKISGSQLVFRSPVNHNAGRQYLRSYLYTASGNLADGNALVSDDVFDNAYDAADAIKIANFGESFGLRITDKILAVEARQQLTATDTVFYDLKNLSIQNYQLKIAPENMGSVLLIPYLVDKFTGSIQQLSFTDSSFVNFAVTTDLASKDPGRLYIIFRQLVPVPVLFTNISALLIDAKTVAVSWHVENEINIKRYEIERSTSPAGMKTIGAVNPLYNGIPRYVFLDKQPLTGNNFYRVKAIADNGDFQYSKIVNVFVGSLAGSVSIFPNPVIDKNIFVYFKDQRPGKYEVRLFNKAGQLITKGNLSSTASAQTFNIRAGNIEPGIYQLRISDCCGNIKAIEVFVR